MGGSTYSAGDIIDALVEVGLEQGDIAYFATGLGMLGHPIGISGPEELHNLFLDAIKTVLGAKGTILVPAYSYTFGGSTKESPKIFDPENTVPKVGPFPAFFLEQVGVVRSLDPMMSMAALGPAAEELFANLSPTSYGKDCVYERLLAHPNAKCVTLGLGPNFIPFLHHLDWLAEVPFRYDKYFYGGIATPAGIEYVTWHYPVAVRIPESEADAHELADMTVEAGIWQVASLGRGRVHACNYKRLFDFSLGCLMKDKWLTARGPARDVSADIQAEKSRTGDES